MWHTEAIWSEKKKQRRREEMVESASASTLSGGAMAFMPLVTVVGFHHARGPEIENWFGADEGTDPAVVNEWPLLPFMALSDGAHA